MEADCQTASPDQWSRSDWTGRVSASVSVEGALSSSFEGSFGFTVYLSEKERVEVDGQVVPRNTVLGRMGGEFRSEMSAPTGRLAGNGTLNYFVGGEYDSATETVRLTLAPSGMEATGRGSQRGDSYSSPDSPFSINWNTGRRSPMDDAYEDLPKTAIVVEPPSLPASETFGPEALRVIRSVPRTERVGSGLARLDLRDPDPQTVSYSNEDEMSTGIRVTRWTFVLVPLFTIERDDRRDDQAHTFLSSDDVSLHISIPGVTVAGSPWEDMVSWQVTGRGLNPGSGIPSHGSGSATFAFRPNPPEPPARDARLRPRSLTYDISATIEGTTQHYFIKQDMADFQGSVTKNAEQGRSLRGSEGR